MDRNLVKSNPDFDALAYTIGKIEEKAKRLIYHIKDLEEERDDFLESLKALGIELLDLEEPEERKCAVYYILNEDKSLVKIGVSCNPIKRAQNMQTSTGWYLDILNVIWFDSRREAEDVEKYLHWRFGEYRRTPNKIFKSSEWFDATIVATLLRDYSNKEKTLVAKESHNRNKHDQMEKVRLGI